MTPETLVKRADGAVCGKASESEGLRMVKDVGTPVAKRRKGAGERKG